ncbi:MAG: DUF2262 domain-containing protein [[Clostridium] innocuum]
MALHGMKKPAGYAAEQLLSCAIDWQDEAEDELRADDFARRIRIEAVNVSQDGEFELYYDDGDIFAGHVIIVSGNMEKGCMMRSLRDRKKENEQTA